VAQFLEVLQKVHFRFGHDCSPATGAMP